MHLVNPFIFDNKFDPDYKSVLSTATSNGFTKPSSGQQIIQNQLVLDLKAIGVWDKLDVLHIFASDSGNGFVKINWINRVVGTSTYSGGSPVDFLKVENSHITHQPGFSVFDTLY